MSRKRLPKYPSKPHSSGQARICLEGKRYYLGKFGSTESHVRFHRILEEYLTTGSLPGRAIDPVSERLKKWIQDFDDSLDNTHGVGIRFVSCGQVITFRLESISCRGPLVLFCGHLEDGSPVDLSILLTGLRREDPSRPKPQINVLDDVTTKKHPRTPDVWPSHLAAMEELRALGYLTSDKPAPARPARRKAESARRRIEEDVKPTPRRIRRRRRILLGSKGYDARDVDVCGEVVSVTDQKVRLRTSTGDRWVPREYLRIGQPKTNK